MYKEPNYYHEKEEASKWYESEMKVNPKHRKELRRAGAITSLILFIILIGGIVALKIFAS